MIDIGTALASAVIFLFAQNQTGQEPIGTAFIVGYPVPGKPGQSVPLVVTAKHVIGDRMKVFGRFSTQEGKATATFEYDLTALRRAGDYWEHKDSGVDIVVFRTPHFEQAKYQVVPLELIASKEAFRAESIQTTDRVVYPGLLVNFMGLSRNYPIVRSGSIALIPDEPVPMRYLVGSKTIETQQEAILIDGTAVAGESGSPVFLWPGPRLQGNAFTVGGTKPLVLGVLHGFYLARQREIKNIQTTRLVQGFAENSHIAIVFPSWKLREIIELPAVAARIEQLIKIGNQ
ncbi:MAG: hypothetical protein MUQ00_12455 [Candidatus Aminicenantes bacterium]|nr:hypothetical protein [Candidatus Aminicenantes bacterium]